MIYADILFDYSEWRDKTETDLHIVVIGVDFTYIGHLNGVEWDDHVLSKLSFIHDEDNLDAPPNESNFDSYTLRIMKYNLMMDANQSRLFDILYGATIGKDIKQLDPIA